MFDVILSKLLLRSEGSGRLTAPPGSPERSDWGGPVRDSRILISTGAAKLPIWSKYFLRRYV